MEKVNLTIQHLISEAQSFCTSEAILNTPNLYGVTDGKAVGTYVEHQFKQYLSAKYKINIGNSASGLDLPSSDILTDIKVTSIKQPQSSCPFKDAKQKIFGLGYNLLVFVYDKHDDIITKTAKLDFVSATFIEKERTADYQTTLALLQMLENGAIEEEIMAYLSDRNIPADDITLNQLAKQILKTPPKQGYLTISNALQWRLQYGRIVTMEQEVKGITRIIDRGRK
ncbi:MAG: hypothetical protein MUF45_09000 [Spirosomaceae bacterium]|jgi:hypothetical protein|nr:hypothetical protein [Spirosomataceae bacterium]